MAHDPVNHPSHYTQGKVECIDAIRAALGPVGFQAYLRGQVIKYNWRLGLKDDAAQDAGKAKWYQDLLAKELLEWQEQADAEMKKLQRAEARRKSKGNSETFAGHLSKMMDAVEVAAPTNLGAAQTDDNLQKKEISHDLSSSNLSPHPNCAMPFNWICDYSGIPISECPASCPGWKHASTKQG